MEVIKCYNYEEVHAKLNRSNYVESPRTIDEIQPSVWSHQWSGTGVKTWIIVVAIAAAAAILGLAIVCRLYHNQGKQGTVSINIDNSNLNPSPTAPETTLVNTATNTIMYMEKEPKNGPSQIEENKPKLPPAEEEARAIELTNTRKWQ